jgi:hypothetical protein
VVSTLLFSKDIKNIMITSQPLVKADNLYIKVINGHTHGSAYFDLILSCYATTQSEIDLSLTNLSRIQKGYLSRLLFLHKSGKVIQALYGLEPAFAKLKEIDYNMSMCNIFDKIQFYRSGLKTYLDISKYLTRCIETANWVALEIILNYLEGGSFNFKNRGLLKEADIPETLKVKLLAKFGSPLKV